MGKTYRVYTMQKWKWILIGLVGVLVIAAAGFIVWAGTPLAATAEAGAALQPDEQVQVIEQNGWMVFQPAAGEPSTGFIFYPGGRVDARAYAPLLRDIAAQGYLAVIVPMPLNLALFGVNAAADVQAAFPAIQTWAVGGHSLGGAMAARYAQANPVAGLVFWASYPDIDLSQTPLAVVSIYGTRDGVANAESLENSRALLPTGTRWVAVEGGNHSGFGSYGLQPGDNEATISADDQRAQVVAATVELLASLQAP